MAEHVPERTRRLIFGNAFVLNDGESLSDAVLSHCREVFDTRAPTSEDNTVMLPFPIWWDAFINDACLASARSAYGQLSPEPYQPFVDKLDMKNSTLLISPGVNSTVLKT